MKTSEAMRRRARVATTSAAIGCLLCALAQAQTDAAEPVPGESPAASPPVAVSAPDGAGDANDGATRAASSVPGAASAGRRGGELSLQTTSVSGNRELPRVMVVVPWKTAAPAELGGRPIVSLVEEALAPVDPEVFRRRLEYYALLHGETGKDAGELAKTASNLTEE